MRSRSIKYLSLLFAACLFVGCGGSDDNNGDNSGKDITNGSSTDNTNPDNPNPNNPNPNNPNSDNDNYDTPNPDNPNPNNPNPNNPNPNNPNPTCKGDSECPEGSRCVKANEGDDEVGRCVLEEEKDDFQCKSDNDCLVGSKCVKAKEGEDVIGRCTREEDIDHCVDKDGDGFYTSEPQFDVECGYDETHPKDPDDANPMVYYGAPELCDGVDNSGDGCVDGICEAGDCKSDASKCKIIENPCWGSGNISNYDKSVCSKALIGYEKCEGGVLKYIPGSDAELAELGACPKSTSQIKGYVAVESDSTCNNGIDDNCNTMVDEGCGN